MSRTKDEGAKVIGAKCCDVASVGQEFRLAMDSVIPTPIDELVTAERKVCRGFVLYQYTEGKSSKVDCCAKIALNAQDPDVIAKVGGPEHCPRGPPLNPDILSDLEQSSDSKRDDDDDE